MFSKPINENRIPPNFLNSILTNEALYTMFKNDFEKNTEYFQKIDKDEYLYAMLKFITDKLYSKNALQIYEENFEESKLDNNSFLICIENFYNDFYRKEILEDENKIYSNDFLKALEYCRHNDLYAPSCKKFIEIYNSIMDSLHYREITEKSEKYFIDKLKSGTLSISDFDLLSNYIKNNIDNCISMELVLPVIRNHAYKLNHIFDRDVIRTILNSIVNDYLKEFEMTFSIIYKDEIDMDDDFEELDDNTIYIEAILIDTFISGNYIELIHELFFKMDILKDRLSIKSDSLTLGALNSIMRMTLEKIDLDKLINNQKYYTYSYISNLKANAFVKTLKFYQAMGVDLFTKYIGNQIKKITFEENTEAFSKDVFLDIRFALFLANKDREKIASIRSKSSILAMLYDEFGNRKKAANLLKYSSKHEKLIEDYLYSSIPIPDVLIDDVCELETIKTDDKHKNDIIERLLKYIYCDLFHFSIESFIEINKLKKGFNPVDYLDDLRFKTSCLKDTPLSHKFKEIALSDIDEMKKNYLQDI